MFEGQIEPTTFSPASACSNHSSIAPHDGVSAAQRFSQRSMPTGKQSGIKLSQVRPKIANDCRHDDSTDYNNNRPSRSAQERVVPAIAALIEQHFISTS
ncbi:hypothetical protein [Sphingomonas glacialis]|uniref:Uncharacterized protein n=1 Tax=Sphingomonas glacialis TaxID=658225 RepID=A0A502FGF3_9SPHN|nr:hypothetical protein [Sphingomonas glacialis]TPG48313.1 hypothetical protein EAH76_21160 [Sphingomonas glacialis]